jgi:hypothetical protein
MDRLAPSNVPVYTTDDERARIWERCVERGLPVVAVRDARRGWIVAYDLGHLDRELDERTVRELRERVRSRRDYPTGIDPLSMSEGVGGEAGPVSGRLHADTEREARETASRISPFLLA